MGGLYREHPEFVMVFLESVSGITMLKIKIIVQKFVDSGAHMLEYALQMSLDLKLPQMMIIIKVCEKYFKDRYAIAGNRFDMLPKEAIKADGTLDWSLGCYRPICEGGSSRQFAIAVAKKRTCST